MRPLVAFAALVVIIAATVTAAGPLRAAVRPSAPAPAECIDAPVPLGALAPAEPAWCDGYSSAVDTARRGTNTWADSFAGAMHSSLGAGYLVFDDARRTISHAATTVYRTETFAHNDHWMVDIAGSGSPIGQYEGSAEDFFVGPNNGGSLMRPDEAFHFDDGKLVVQFDVSAGMTAYGERVWPEVVVTTAPRPSTRETNGWYAAGQFGGAAAIGCALPADRLSECRIYDADKITAWLSAQSAAGAPSVYGGTPLGERAAAWRLCRPTDPDASCRDHFRLELTRDSVSLFVNGVKYMQHAGLPSASQLPAELLTQPVYVYFASWAYLPEATVARVHWGAIAINPQLQLMK
ncbi:MAG TPA: hypothetical protein VI814_10650 [Candidatus Limnocylindria bacterium]